MCFRRGGSSIRILNFCVVSYCIKMSIKTEMKGGSRSIKVRYTNASFASEEGIKAKSRKLKKESSGTHVQPRRIPVQHTRQIQLLHFFLKAAR